MLIPVWRDRSVSVRVLEMREFPTAHLELWHNDAGDYFIDVFENRESKEILDWVEPSLGPFFSEDEARAELDRTAGQYDAPATPGED